MVLQDRPSVQFRPRRPASTTRRSAFRLAGDEQHAIRGLLAGPAAAGVHHQPASGWCAARRSHPTRSRWSCRPASAPGRPAGSTRSRSTVPRCSSAPSGRELREFLYAESEQAYQAADIALLSRHLLVEPDRHRVRRRRRWLLIVRADGGQPPSRSTATATWSPGRCSRRSGRLRAVAMHEGEPFAGQRSAGRCCSCVGRAMGVDHGRTLTSAHGEDGLGRARPSWKGRR